jgi:Ribosomal protein S1
VMDYGVFIELAPNLTGLADACSHLLPGDRVSAYIKTILPESRKIKLRVMEVLPDLKSPPSLHYFVSGGTLSNWNYEA